MPTKELNNINQAVYEDWVLPELKRQKELKRQVEIDEAKVTAEQNALGLLLGGVLVAGTVIITVTQ